MKNISELLKSAEGNYDSELSYDYCISWWQNKLTESNYDYDSLLDNFRIIFTQSSNAIENIVIPYHTTRDIYEDKKISYGLMPTEVFAVRNQKLLFFQMIEDIRNKIQLSENLIKHYHNILLAGCYDDARWKKGERPGNYKIGDYIVGMTQEGSAPDRVERDMRVLIDDVLNTDVKTDDDKLTASVYFHLAFEQIHAFADGNGRIGRAIMNYMLMSYNLPPTAIYAEDKDTYYIGLEVFDRSGQIDGFVQFIKEQTVKTWRKRILQDKNKLE